MGYVLVAACLDWSDQIILGGIDLGYKGTAEQKEILQKAMKELHGERGVSDAQVVHEIRKWVGHRTHSEWPDISTRVYNRYRLDGVKEFFKGELLYNFFSQGPDRFRMISGMYHGVAAMTEDQLFIDTMLRKFGASDRGYNYSHLESMAFSYQLYRRSWRIQDGKHFVRSLLRVEKLANVFRLTEIQSFNARGSDIDEVDNGWLFPYSTNFFALTNSPYCMKFYDFHDVYPEPAEGIAVNEMKGHLVAVSGKGEHPSFRIFARRSVSSAVKLDHCHVSDFKEDKSMHDVLEYIMG